MFKTGPKKIIFLTCSNWLTYSGKECIGFGISPIDNIITSQNIKILNPKMVDTFYSDHDLLICDLSVCDD